MEAEPPAATPPATPPAAAVSSGSVAAMRRLVESVIIAVVTSTGLYLVGSVYTDAYYGRMSIEVTSLDLSPTFIGVQSMHVLQSLLGYPLAVLTFYVLGRLLASRARRLRSWYDRAHHRFERSVLLVTNLVVVTPLVIDAIRAAIERSTPGSAVVSEISALLGTVVTLLVAYVVWLSLGPRAFLISQIRQRKLLPIALVGLAYLSGALIATADTAALAAEVFMVGTADTSLVVELTMQDELPAPGGGAELLFVAARHGNYFVVERQSFPPDLRPRSYVIPFSSVEFATVQRVNAVGQELIDFIEAEINADAPSAAP